MAPWVPEPLPSLPSSVEALLVAVDRSHGQYFCISLSRIATRRCFKSSQPLCVNVTRLDFAFRGTQFDTDAQAGSTAQTVALRNSTASYLPRDAIADYMMISLLVAWVNCHRPWAKNVHASQPTSMVPVSDNMKQFPPLSITIYCPCITGIELRQRAFQLDHMTCRHRPTPPATVPKYNAVTDGFIMSLNATFVDMQSHNFAPPYSTTTHPGIPLSPSSSSVR